MKTAAIAKTMGETGSPPIPDFDAGAFFERVVSLVPGIVYVFNQQTMANEYSNRSVATLLGYSPDEIIEMGDALLETVIHSEDLPGLIGYFRSLEALDEGSFGQFEYRIFARDGSIVWLRSIDAVFQRASDGSILRHIGVASDATEQKNRSLELAELNESLAARIAERTNQLADLNANLEKKVEVRTAELTRINSELEQLTYIATHDLKVPITNLTHLAQILADDISALNPEQEDVVKWMKTSCAQAREKLDGLVLVAHARSADLSPCGNVSLVELAKTSCAVLKHEINTRDAVVNCDFDAAQWIDYPHFEGLSIFENLIGNALKYAHQDRPPRVDLRSWKMPGRVCVSVRDNGTGLQLSRDAEKVFGLFKRAHRDPPGSGIALYTIRKILERYGGSIEVDSVLGEWTEFTLTFAEQGQAAIEDQDQ